MKYNELLENLKIAVNSRITDREMMYAFGLKSPSAITNKKNKNSFINEEEIKKVERYFAVSLSKNNTLNLDYYPNVFGSCGRGCVVFDESKEKISVTKDLIKNHSNSKKYSVISACGCSMSPTIEDGDKLIVEHFENSQIKDNRVYIFEYKNELFIKRLVKNIDQIVCISENKDFENRIITDLKQFKIIGEIVGLYREKV